MSTATFDRFAAEVEAFERLTFAQAPFAPAHYDDEYFVDDWRAGDNRYDLETRRRIEGPNPQLIKDVLEPSRVLDVGCGPGFLLAFLHELGVEADGIDFSPSSRTLAPDQIRDRIVLGDVSESHVDPQSYDVVVCREVLEHLTVLQIRRTVEQLCRASSRFVYVTTRFHPEPAHLLDVTDDFATDPTHVTLLAKDFLRCLFVLEGFKSRPDLEARLDWADKRRVLVYERQAP